MLPIFILMMAIPFNFLLGIVGGLVAWMWSKKDTKGIVGAIVGGLLSPILGFVFFKIDSDLAVKLFLEPMNQPMLSVIDKLFNMVR